MYLTQQEVNDTLNTPFFTQPVTETIVNYGLYRGHMNVEVYTYRFNLQRDGTFNSNYINTYLSQSLLSEFAYDTRLLGSINYDFLLVNRQTNSFYIWRSNSNAVHFDIDNETLLILNHANIQRHVGAATRFDLPRLNLNFASSAVEISRVLAIVFSFIVLV